MLLDRYNGFMQRLHRGAFLLVAPVQYIVNKPINSTESFISLIRDHSSLSHQNQELSEENNLLRSNMQRLIALKHENQELKKLLETSAKLNNQVAQAQILAVSSEPYLHQVVIDLGSTHGVYQGQPVVDAHGIYGQVIEVGMISSRVMLVNDEQSQVPVEDARNGVRAIAVGSPDGILKLKDVPETADVKQGDLFISSGLGQCYPYGYPVGTASMIEQSSNNGFLNITLVPSARLNQGRLVLVVWPKKAPIDKAIVRHLSKKHAGAAHEEK